jgi:hypothetical protein
LVAVAHKKAMADSAARRTDLQTGEMEWFTPGDYIEKARRVLGVIDIDPASCAEAQQVVKAGCFFSKNDDGLHATAPEQQCAAVIDASPPRSCRFSLRVLI